MPRGARSALLFGLPLALLLALQLRALDYAFVWTDDAEYLHGSVLRPPGEIARAWLEPLHRVSERRAQQSAQPYYRPLQVVVSSLVAQQLPREPRSFRSVSLALACAALALFGALAGSLHRSAAAGALAACVVAAHPGTLESYVWIGGQSAALAAVFVLAGVGAGAAALDAARRGRALALGAGALACLLLGLASKENAAVLPALLAAWACSAARMGRDLRRVARRMGALVGAELALVAGYLLWWRPRVLGGALTGAPPLGGSAETQLATSLAFWPEALAWLFAPLRSNTSDAVRVVASLGDPAALAGLALAGLSAAAWLALLWRRQGVAAFGLAWLWLAFLPTSGLVPLLHLRSERNLFLSLFGAALLWPCAGPLLRRAGAPRAVCAGAAALLVLGLAQRSWQRIPDWRSTRALFTRDVAADPQHREGRMNLALEAFAEGRPQEAQRQLAELFALRAERGRVASYLRDESLFELACLVSRSLGDERAALELYERELQAPGLLFRNPGFFDCLVPLLERAGRFADAARVHAGLHQLTQGDARHALGAARNHLKAGQLDAARAWLARIPPGSASAAGFAPQIARIERALEAARAPALR